MHFHCLLNFQVVSGSEVDKLGGACVSKFFVQVEKVLFLSFDTFYLLYYSFNIISWLLLVAHTCEESVNVLMCYDVC